MVFGRVKGEPLSNVDAAWLHMEDPTNLMLITAVMSFSEKLDFDRLKNLIEDRLLCHERFRQKIVEPSSPLSKPMWVDDEKFNLRSHLQRVALPDPGGQHELQEMVSTLMSTPLDFSKPLWQFQYIENYRGGCALVGRLHHCIADGIALIRVLLAMTEENAGPPVRGRRRRRNRHLAGFLLPEVVNDALRSVRKVTGTLVEEGVDTILHPERLAEYAREGAKAAGVLGRLATMPADPDTVFSGTLGTAKRCAWSEIMPLADVKALGKRSGATINDVLLTGVCGALRRYMLSRGSDVDGLDIRAVIPVNLRPDEEVGKLGNKFGLVFLSLPVGTPEPKQRLKLLHQRMDDIKGSSEPIVVFGLLNAVGMASAEIEGLALQLFGSKATGVMTNVPGPREQLYFAGKPMRSMMFWVPQSARLGLGVSILSYNGEVRLGVATDAGLVPDPEAIIEAFQDEMNELMEG